MTQTPNRGGVGWQPIETAPRDQTVILYFTPKPDGDGRYHMSRADDRYHGAYWLQAATHWMPLTPPPVSAS